MGKPTGFIDYEREDAKAIEPKERIKNFKEFHIPLSMEKQQIQGARCMNCGVPFCQSGMTIMGMTSGCPLHNLVPEWNDLVYTGNWEQAYNRLKKTNNFPEFTSRVCPALCEAACTCGHWEDPVTCKANEHGIIENAYAKGYAAAKPPRVRTGKKVAIIGSGPAGLAAADQLNKRGHQVTVFERDDRVGGLLMYGIPNMKLEKWVIDRKVDIMKEEGVEFVTSVNVGKDVKAAKLLKDYDRVILACGAKNPRDIKAPGRDAKGIYFAVDFLKATTKSLLDSEFFAGRSRVKRVVMMLTSSEKADALRVALATTHLPLAKVPAAITGELLDDVIGILVRDLRERFGISAPKIAVTGLNPHAGESGHMGREEIDVISPAIGRAQQKGSSVTGPWPADTIFVREHERHYDAILCMYHDQGLPVLKREGFGHGINVTLGLPWIRTSVDHGTALDIAGKNIADTGSMTAALDLARQMVRHATGDYSF